MTDKVKFFFEPDTQADNDTKMTTEEHADTFFSTLVDAGFIQQNIDASFEAKTAEALASMKRLESSILQVDFGTYQDNYAVHVTPVNPKRNLSTDLALKRALKEIVLIMNEYVPFTCQVNLFLPRDEWKMKVISAVVVNGANAWNFDHSKFESEAAPKIFQAVEKVIQQG